MLTIFASTAPSTNLAPALEEYSTEVVTLLSTGAPFSYID